MKVCTPGASVSMRTIAGTRWAVPACVHSQTGGYRSSSSHWCYHPCHHSLLLCEEAVVRDPSLFSSCRCLLSFIQPQVFLWFLGYPLPLSTHHLFDLPPSRVRDMALIFPSSLPNSSLLSVLDLMPILGEGHSLFSN